MCGIVGVITAATNGFDLRQENVFYDMLKVDTLRGEDSTGVVFIENDGSFAIMKEATPAYYCADTMKSEVGIGTAMFNWGKAMIGHNRKATIGKIKDETAHPFVVDDHFAMVHNGTLYNHRALANTEVDSEALAIHLSKYLNADFDLQKFEEGIGKVEGAYAVAAYNQKNEHVYLLRNSQRPLALAITKKDGIFWASEIGMLFWILSRQGIDLKDAEIHPLKEHTLFAYDCVKNEYSFTEYVPKKPQPVVTKATGKKEATTNVSPTTSALTGPTTSNNVEDLSKNAFKRLQRRLQGQFLSFFVDDYVEDNFPRTVDDGETKVTLLGEDQHLEATHSIHAKFDISQLSQEDKERGWLDRFYTGRIYRMEFDRNTRHITIYVDKVQVVPKSVPAVIDDKYIAQKLEEKEKNEISPTLH